LRRTYKGGSYQDILSYLISISIIDKKARARDKNHKCYFASI